MPAGALPKAVPAEVAAAGRQQSMGASTGLALAMQRQPNEEEEGGEQPVLLDTWLLGTPSVCLELRLSSKGFSPQYYPVLGIGAVHRKID